MAYQLTILQFRTDSSLEHEQKCFIKYLQLNKNQIQFINLFDKNFSYKNFKEFINKNTKPIIIGGSGEFYLAKRNKPKEQKIIDNLKKNFYPILKQIIQQNRFYTLGVCFGMQLLSDCIGKLENDLEQAETGIFEIHLTEEGKKHKLFENIKTKFKTIVGHQDSVTQLPAQCKVLAYSKKCPIQGVEFNSKIFGVQFHPELKIPDLIERLRLYPNYKKFQEQQTFPNYRLTQAQKILRNFLKICNIK